MDIANGPVMLVIQMSLLLSVSLGEMIRNDLCAPCVCTSKNETSGLYTVSCASNPTLKGHIPKFKHILEDQIIQLDMSNNNLHNLTSQTKTPFANFSELQELNMFNTSLKFRMNSITTIDNETFVGLSKLKVLNISHNVDLPLTNLTDEYLFNHLTSLRKLIMYQTTFIYHINKSYPSNVWKNIPSLQEIWIDGFSLEPFGKDFRNMSNLQIVVISGNLTSPIEEYPDFCDMEEITDNTLFNLVHVTDLSIVHCGIESISKNAFQNLVKLQKLDLSQNDALTLEMASRSFTSLHRGIQYLYLDSVDKVNSLGCDVNITTTMAESLSHTSLNTLSLDDNRIKSVEIDAFLKLPKTLEHLSVKQNKFELGFYMFYAYQLTNLKSIDLSYNFFGHAYSLWRQPNSLTVSRNDLNPKMTHDELGRSVAISDDIECQKPQNFIPTISVTGFLPPKLEEIDISNSKIGFPIYDFYIDTNNSLKRVIGSNSLLYCWAGPVHGVKHVEVVDLSNNFCSIVKKDFFKNMPNLKQLFLKNNNLFYVVQNKRLFYANFEIEIIDLSFNRISRLHPLLFANQTKMRIINLANNNLIEFDSRISQMKSLVSLDMSYNHMYTLTKELRSDLDIIRASRQNGSLTLNLKRNAYSLFL
ncbi:toll-like receptor 4 [Dreissena polymorpha]|uniref:Toll-like receptor n=1 Tax=Dreissena polymorpha TaxID=45954 RepID=A0A9D4EVA9_DREPO|nr:toll-like receptor 4 [Dreissena polymorpha]KAH3786374.1 hypothetical protein DPMN_164481 [Dreissena polymorpha]